MLGWQGREVLTREKHGQWAQEASPAPPQACPVCCFLSWPVTSSGCIAKESGAPWALKRVAEDDVLWPSMRTWVGTIRKGPAGVRSQIQACSRCAVLQGRQETGKEHGLTRVLCSPFPLPDQHWSVDVPSDAEAELQLRVSENEEEQPSVTAWRQERGGSTIAGEATPRIPSESHVKTSGTKGIGPRAEPAHYTLASKWPPPRHCAWALHMAVLTAPLCMLFEV